MESIDLAIKFVSSSQGSGSGASVPPISSTGDLLLFAAIILAFIMVASGVLLYRAWKKSTLIKSFNVASDQACNYTSDKKTLLSSTKNKVLAVIFCIAFLLSVLAFVVSGNNSAQAIQTAHFKGTDIIGFVDETTGNVTFSDGAITNIGNKNAVIEQVITKRPDGIDDGNCTWTLKSGDVSLFNGITSTQGTTTILEQELDVLVGSSIPLSVSVDGLGADKAKSLIEKNVISLSFKLKEKTPEVSVTGVKLDQSCLNLELGSSTKLNETVEPENATNKSVLWSSSDDKVASVNDNGIVTANAEGQANVVVTTNDGGYKDTCTVTVQNKQIKVKTYAEQNLTYTGYAQKLGYVIPDVEDCEILYTVDGTSVAGEPKATNAGVHKVGYKVSKTGYTTAEGSFDVLIAKAKVDVPIAEVGLVYNTKEQVGVKVSEGETRYNVSDNVQTEAGDYNATATLTDKTNYVWNTENPSSNDQIIPWTINKADPTLDVDDYASYNVPTEFEFDTNYNGDGNISVISSNSEKVKVELIDKKVRVYPLDSGNVTITVSATSGKNYNAVTKSQNASINAGQIEYNATPVAGLIYDGTEKNLVEVSVVSPIGCTISYKIDDKTATEPKAKDAGTYKVNYKIEKTGYTTVEDSFEVTIAQVKVDLPKAKSGLVYNAEEQTGVKLPEGETRYTLSNASATNAGKHTATAKLVDTKNYVWDISDPTSSDLTIDWNINQKTLYGGNIEGIPVSYTYDGEEHKPVPTKVTTDDGLTVTSDSYTVKYPTEGDYKEPGSYEVEVCAKPDSNFKDSVSQAFLIVKQEESLMIDLIKDQTYNGSEIKPDITVRDKSSGAVLQPNQYSKFYINNKNVGTAQVAVTGLEEYLGCYGISSFTINKKELTVNGASVADKEYDGTNAATIEDKGNLEGVISPDIVSIESATASFMDPNAGKNKQVNLNYVISQEANNYVVKNPTDIVASINPAKVDVPKAKTGLVYNTKEQVGVKVSEGETRYTLSNASATNAGNHTAISELTDKNNYVWNVEQPTTDNQKIDWSIAKATNNMMFSVLTSTYTSEYSENSVKIDFPGIATNSPENLEYGVGAVKLDDTDSTNEGNFVVEYDDVNNKWYLISEANTAAGEYQLKIWAKSGGTNYEEIYIPDKDSFSSNFSWIIREPAVPVTSVSIDKSSIDLVTDTSAKLTEKVLPENSTDKSVVWSSDNNDVASVDKDGNVAAHKSGNATITVVTNDGGYTASCLVKVRDLNALKPIVKTIDNQDVVFLPAYTGDEPPCNFYYKNDDSFEKIDDITDMRSLDSLILSMENAKNIYTDATKQTFYGVMQRSWENTFEGVDSRGYATGIETEFSKQLSNANVSTVYNFSDENRTAWDAYGAVVGSKTPVPELNNVPYGTSRDNRSEFYGAYSNLLNNKYAFAPFSSRSDGNNKAYEWFIDDNESSWMSNARSSEYGIVLSTYFENPVSVTGVTLDKSSLDIEKDKSAKLTETILPEYATDKAVSWESSDDSVATVDQNGTVTATGSGNATITVTTVDGGYKATCAVNVIEHVTGVTLDKDEFSLSKGETAVLKETVIPDNATDKSVSWESSNDSVATVDQNGTVTATGSGNATITVTTNDGGYKATCAVNVIEHVTGVTLNINNLNLSIGETAVLEETVIPDNATDKSVSWESSNDSVATVDQKGKVTATGSGNAEITVTTNDGGYKAICAVTTNIIRQVSSVECGLYKICFLPVFEDTNPGYLKENKVRFYTDDKGENPCTEINNKIEAGCTMSDFAKAFESVKSEYTLFACALESVKFYGTVDYSWGDTFSDNSKLNDKFIQDFKIGQDGRGTVYCTGSKWDTAYYPPTLSSSGKEILYKDFYNAYKGLGFLSLNATKPWSSQQDSLTSKDNAKYYDTSTEKWSSDKKDVLNGVVLSLDFNHPVSVTGVTLDQSKLDLLTYSSAKLTETVKPNNATDKSVSWSSNNEEVARVDQSGNITANKKGTAVITVTTNDGGYTATCLVTVRDSSSFKSIVKTIDNQDVVFLPAYSGEEAPCNFYYKEDGAFVKIDNITDMRSLDSEIITVQNAKNIYTDAVNQTFYGVMKRSWNNTFDGVDSRGYATGLNTEFSRLLSDAGVYTVYNFTDENRTAWDASGAILDANTPVPELNGVPYGTSKNKTSEFYGAYSNLLNNNYAFAPFSSRAYGDNNAYEWFINDNKSSWVSNVRNTEYGIVLSLGYDVSVTGVSVNKTEIDLSKGDRTQLKASIEPYNASDKSVTWSSSDESVATVDQNGLITAKDHGSATITVKTIDGSYTATCEVYVDKIHVDGITLDKSTLDIEPGKTVKLTETISPRNAEDKSVTWSSSDESVATVDQNGNITSIKDGSAKITVTTNDRGYSATCDVNVAVHVTGVTLDKSSLDIKKGQSAKLTETISPANATNKTVKWSSSDENIVKVDQYGNVTPNSGGSATITVTTEDGEYTDTCLVTVTVPVTGVYLSEGSISMESGDTNGLTAIISPYDATNKNKTWSSNNESVATVDQNGVVTAKKEGSATITVTTEDGSFNDECIVTVSYHIQQISNVRLGDQVVNFMPAFSQKYPTFLKVNDVKFYEGSEFYERLCDTLNNLVQQGCTMSEFAEAYKSVSSKTNIFAAAPAGVKFYGTINNSWENTFAGNAKLSEKFKSKYNIGRYGINTVYCSGGIWDTAEGYPQLDGGGSKANYDNFYNAYKGLLSTAASSPWTSKQKDSTWSYLWVSEGTYHGWQSHGKENKYAVVISLDFKY